jgi:SAM-dependent MidA family methyltransferase
LKQGLLSSDEFFQVSEFGCGEGVLARDFCRAVSSRSQTDPEWERFRQSLCYQAVEQSRSLCERIEKNLDGTDVRYGVLNSDAVSFMRKARYSLGKGLVISNELVDAFPVEIFRKSENGVDVTHVIPRIRTRVLAGQAELRESAIAGNSLVRAKLGIPDSVMSESFLLDSRSLRSILDSLGEISGADRAIVLEGLSFIETSVPLEDHPRIRGTLKTYISAAKAQPNFLGSILPPDAVEFFSGIQSKLKCGYVITVDYGGPFAEIQDRFQRYGVNARTYCNGTTHLSPYQRFSDLDITSNVDFSYLKWLGFRHGLDQVHFGRQSDLCAGLDPCFTDQILALKRKCAKKFFQGNRFKMLIQATQNVEARPGWPLLGAV